MSKVEKLVLVSNNICVGPCPEPENIIEQHLSINANGNTCVSYYAFGENDKERVNSLRLCIVPASADRLLQALDANLRSQSLNY